MAVSFSSASGTETPPSAESRLAQLEAKANASTAINSWDNAWLLVSTARFSWCYDDSLDVFGVHGVGSMLGMLMLGFLANIHVNEQIGTTCRIDGQLISLAGGGAQFFNQLKGVCFTVAFAGAATFLLLRAVGNLVGLRVNEEAETLGLDLSQHGESAYND